MIKESLTLHFGRSLRGIKMLERTEWHVQLILGHRGIEPSSILLSMMAVFELTSTYPDLVNIKSLLADLESTPRLKAQWVSQRTLKWNEGIFMLIWNNNRSFIWRMIWRREYPISNMIKTPPCQTPKIILRLYHLPTKTSLKNLNLLFFISFSCRSKEQLLVNTNTFPHSQLRLLTTNHTKSFP